jgi:hypothetical protein
MRPEPAGLVPELEPCRARRRSNADLEPVLVRNRLRDLLGRGKRQQALGGPPIAPFRERLVEPSGHACRSDLEHRRKPMPRVPRLDPRDPQREGKALVDVAEHVRGARPCLGDRGDGVATMAEPVGRTQQPALELDRLGRRPGIDDTLFELPDMLQHLTVLTALGHRRNRPGERAATRCWRRWCPRRWCSLHHGHDYRGLAEKHLKPMSLKGSSARRPESSCRRRDWGSLNCYLAGRSSSRAACRGSRHFRRLRRPRAR